MLISLRSLFHFTCLAVLFVFLPFTAQAESIKSFDSKVVLSVDSSFKVHEKIDYFFDEPRHGIFRIIPTNHPLEDPDFYKERITKLNVESVMMDGESVPYTVDKASSEINIKIGDPALTIEGSHVYEITYTVEGGLSYFDSGKVDLYWNVTGNDWPTPIEKVTATISGETGMFLEERTCYEGFVGMDDTCEISADTEVGPIFSSKNLIVGEGLTIAQSINPTMVEKVELVDRKWGILLFLFFLLGIIYGAFRLYQFEVKHKTGLTIVAEYEPYPGVKPMYTGLLFDGNLDTKDITASIVYLAEQGFLKIKRTEKKILFLFEVDDYEITVIKSLNEGVSNFEKKILELLFGSNLSVGETVSLQELSSNLSKQAKNREILMNLKAELAADLLKEGFFEKGTVTGLSYTRQILIGIVLAIFVAYFLGPLIILFVVVFVIWAIVREQRRTRKGYEVLDHLMGFKLFLEMTDKERFDFHNAPEKSPQQFMEYLPYAIAFGVEEKWAKAFEGIVMENPGWYDNGGVGAFSAMNLTTSMNAFSTALASSSSSSASGGGGSSGGGGGGGGGGSW